MASGHGGRWANCVNRGSAGTLTEKHIVWWGSMFNMFKTCWFGEVVLVSMFGTCMGGSAGSCDERDAVWQVRRTPDRKLVLLSWGLFWFKI